MPKLRNIVYLSEAQKQTLFTDGTITVGTTTVDYSDNDIYVVQQLWNTDGSNSANYYIKDNTNTPRFTLSSSGMVTASGFSGSGASLTNLNANNISTGTINLLRLPAEVWTSYKLTNLNQLTNGPGYITGNQSITLSGDVTGTGSTAITTALKNSGVTAGSYTAPTISVDAKGRITAASSNTIPTVHNSTLTITAGNGLTTGGTFTTNQSSASAVTVTLGTPGNITTSSTNSVSSTSHTHALVLPQSIATTATPSFSGIGLGAGTQTWQITDSGSNLLFQAGTTPATRATLYNNGDLTITGKLSATSKSFLIDHPTKPGYKLQYGSLEGPENGVYVRGRLTNSNIIELPEYWANLVDEDSITVTLTAIGKAQKLFVENIKNNKIYIKNSNRIDKNINCFYVVYGERKDVDKLEVEMEVK